MWVEVLLLQASHSPCGSQTWHSTLQGICEEMLNTFEWDLVKEEELV
jgi:hypothetical protein